MAVGKFPVGSRVRCIFDKNASALAGRVGVVEEYAKDIYNVVRFDGDTSSYWLLDSELEFEDQNSLGTAHFVITTKGGAQFKSKNFDLNDEKDLEFLTKLISMHGAEAFLSGGLAGLGFRTSTGTVVSVAGDKIDHIVYHNIPEDWE